MDLSNEEEFLNSREGEIVPLKHNIDSELSPPEAYSVLREYDDTGYTFLLESAETESAEIKQVTEDSEPLNGRGKYSSIGYNPAAIILIDEDEASVENLSGGSTVEFSDTVDQGQIKDQYDQLDVLRDVAPDIDFRNGDEDRPNFTGGLVGFHPYDMIYDIKPLSESIENPASESVFVLADRYLEYDHVEEDLELVFNPLLGGYLEPDEQLDRIKAEAAEIEQLLSVEDVCVPDQIEVKETRKSSRDEYEQTVRETKEKILDGEIYQGVMSRKTDLEIDGDPLAIYSGLREENPSPYMYILEFEDKGVIGASPETLASVHEENGKKIVETNPIAGTRPRGRSPDEDRKLMGEMLADDKERAEHNMLVDLGRNDLRRISKQGTVSVDDYMSVVQYKNVQHLESRVSAELSDDHDRFDAMRSIFPAGTLTGAPKVRAMDIIARQEESPRGIYGGAVGYYSLNGDLNSAIAIRSMGFDLNENGNMNGSIQAGAGIVQDSQPAKEFEETVNKMGSLTQVVEHLGGGRNE